MYANLLGSRVGRAQVDAGLLGRGQRFIPVVDAIATTCEAGASWKVALVNRHPSSHVDCTLRLKGTSPEGRSLNGSFEATVLAGDSPDAYNDIERPHRVVPEKRQLTFREGVVRLPPHSLTVVEVKVN
jgi:alpha-N-arabinofuranosidase